MTTEAYLSGQVRRYHTNPRMAVCLQTNADHSWGVALLLFQLHPNPSLKLIEAAIKHDGGEKKAGDLPFPFKQRFPEFAAGHAVLEKELAKSIGMETPELTDEEELWLRLADKLESALYMGTYGVPISLGLRNAVMDPALKLGVTDQVIEMVRGISINGD